MEIGNLSDYSIIAGKTMEEGCLIRVVGGDTSTSSVHQPRLLLYRNTGNGGQRSEHFLFYRTLSTAAEETPTTTGTPAMAVTKIRKIISYKYNEPRLAMVRNRNK